jgi:hypothetical protein
MGRAGSAICAALIAMTPLAAAAHGSHHRSDDWGRIYRFRSSDRPPRYRDINPRLGTLPRIPCADLGSRDDRGRIRRCASAKAAFERDNPCPSTEDTRGPCPGYIVDHIIPLKRGGPDDPSNMQWQTVEDAKAKDKVE